MFKRRQNDDWDDWEDDFDDFDEDFQTSRSPISLFVAVTTLVTLSLICGSIVWFLWPLLANEPTEIQPTAITEVQPTTVADIQPIIITVVVTATPDTAIEKVNSGATAVALSTTPTSAPPPTSSNTALNPAEYDPQKLSAYMLDLVNQARTNHGLGVVAPETIAAYAGQIHTEDMLDGGFFSHWNREGWGPEHRYAFIGGEHVVMENLHAFSYTYEDGRGAPIEDWVQVIQNAHDGLMNSPGHRANILDPAHTHLGIGMAYNSATGQFRLAQEFTNQYVQLSEPLPTEARRGDTFRVSGSLYGQNLSNILLNLAYEPIPQPMSVDALNRTSTYTGRAQSIDTTTKRVDLTFDEQLTIPLDGQTGWYHVRIFVDLPTGQAQVMNRLIVVRE